MHLFGSRHGLYLVLERGALFAALGSDELPPQEPWDIHPNGNRGTTVAIQGACLGRGGGRVVNDKPYVPAIYAVLDRC